MSRQTVNPTWLRLGLIAVMAVSLIMGFGGAQSALADPLSPLAVTKTASPSPVASGAEITYTITMVNTGGSKVNSVVMTDQLNGVGGIGTPPQLALTSTQGSCAQSSLKVTCTIGSIAGGASATVTIRGIVTAANGTTLNNNASVTGTKSAQNFTTSATVQTLVQNNSTSPLADLSISKTGPSSVVQSAAMTYVLTVNNSGAANATNIRVVDTLPAGVNLASISSTSLFVCSPAGPATAPVTVTCDGGAVNQGSNATITINAFAPATTGSIANTAVVDPNNTVAESNELNNTSATVSTSVTSAPAPQGLTITKTDSPDPVVPGGTLSYTIVVKNIATTRADDVVVVDGTQGLEAASITASQVIVNGTVGVTGGCTVTAPQVRCAIRSLNPNGTQTITIRGQVVASAGSTILNTATVTGNIKNQGVTATATAQTTVMPAVDLTITKADAPDPVCARSWPTPGHLPNPPVDDLTKIVLSPAGGTVPTLLAAPGCLGGLTYTFVVGNSGTANASSVVVRDPLPAGLIFDSYSTNGGFTCAVDAANVVTCTGGAVPSTSTRTISLLLVAPPDTGNISNTVTVDPNNAIYEADETNNTFVQATTVATGIDLVVRKDDSPITSPVVHPHNEGFDPIATSGTETYVITVDNVGTQDVTGIRVRDTLPAGTKFLSVVADATHSFTCSHDGSATGGIVECVGGKLLGTESEFYDPAGPAPAGPGDDIATIKIKVFARPTVGTMHNEVRVDPLNEIVEYNELNNLATQDTTVTNGGASLSAFNELSIVKTQTSPAPPAAVATNGTLKYELTVTNDATDPAVNVHVRDILPAGARFIEAVDTVPGPDAFNCSYAAGVIDCVGGTLDGTLDLLGAAIGQTRKIAITVFAPNTPGDYSNQSIVDPANAIAEGNEFNNNSTIVTKVRTTGDLGQNAFNELTISKTQTAPPSNSVATSSVIIYEIVVANAGTDPAFNVKVKDTLPAGFTYIEATDMTPGAQAFVCTTAPGNVINCTGATLSGTVTTASGQPASRTIQVKALSSAVPGNYTNTAIVDPDNAIPEGDETNNMAQAGTKVLVGAGFIDLQITKTGPAKVVPGGAVQYTLTPSNAGTDPAFNVKVRDDLPAGTTFVSASDSTGGAGAFSCSLIGSSVVCTGGTLDGTDNLIPGPPDVPTSRVIQVKVLAPANIDALAPDKGNISAEIVNQAFIDPDNAIPESNETNNAASATTTVQSKVNLTITKTGPNTASQNTEADYVIAVTNNAIYDGGAVAFNVEVIDPLPVGLIPLSVSADQGNFQCQVLENPVNVVRCNGDLEADQTVTITVHVFVTANGGSLYNQACVDQDNLIAETSELDNCNTAITAVVPPAPDLLINKSADSSVVTPGQSLTYHLSVSNVGNADTTGAVDITDNLPTQITLVNATATNGFTCSGATTIVCSGSSLAIGQSTEIDILTTVNDGVTTSFANTASVSVDPAETNTTNNGPVTVTTSVGGSGIDLEVSSITDTPDPANVNQALTYTIIVVNNGTSTAGTVADPAQVRVDLPQNGVSFVGADGSNGFNCSLSGSTLTCEGVFPGGGSTVITVHLTIDNGAPPDLTVVAIADPTNKFVESNEGNNTKTEVTTVSNSVCTVTPCIDLVMAQVLGSPNPVQVGGGETFTVEVVNVGDSTTAPGNHVNVDVVTLGAFSGPAISAPAGFSCTTVLSGAGFVWYNCSGDLGPGAGVSFTVTMTATGPAPDTIATYASVDLTAGALVPEFTTGNNNANYTTNVVP
jgi:uncharacterized repeat protein (TIGR01451 family)